MVVFLTSFAAAQVDESVSPTFRGSQGNSFNGNSGGGFQGDNSYTFSNPQFSAPGFFGGGLGRYDRIDPALEQELCRERKDFIIQIAPGGCAPNVVRSDILAEQNVPVYCQLQAIQINPTIQPDEIRNIRITPVGGRPEGVAGEGYYRPRNQQFLEGSRGFLSTDNLGFLVVNLKRQPDERNAPDFVSGNLSARVHYDVPEGFGLGVNDIILPVLSDEEWRRDYVKYGFLKGRGFLRLESISGDKARVSVYLDGDRRVDSVSLSKGKKSSEIYLPGFYCNAGFSLNYIDAVKPKDKAVISLGGDKYHVYEGDKFADNLCRLLDISIDDLVGVKKVTVNCHGNPFSLELKVSGASGDSDVPSEDDEFEKFFKSVVEGVDFIDAEFDGNIFLDENSEVSVGERVLKDGLGFVEGKSKFTTESRFRDRLMEGYEERVAAADVVYDDSKASYLLEFGGDKYSVRLHDVEPVSFERYGVEIEVDGNSQGYITSENEDIDIGGTNKISVEEWDNVGVKVSGKCGKNSEDVVIPLSGSRTVCGKNVFVKQLNFESYARVSLNAVDRRVGSVVNLSYAIGIEKRGVELSPVKASQRIEKLNKSIEKWEDRAESLGGVVENMKAACFVTSATLQVKNLFSGMGGTAIARQEVMRGEGGWNEWCSGEVSRDQYNSPDACFSAKASEIESDVKAYSDQLKAVNKQIKSIEDREGVSESSGVFGTTTVDNDESKKLFFEQNQRYLPGLTQDVALSMPYDQLRERVLYGRLQGRGSAQLQAVAADKIDLFDEEVETVRNLIDEKNRVGAESAGLGIVGSPHVNAHRDDPSAVNFVYGGARTTSSNRFDGVGGGKPLEKVVGKDGKSYYVILKSENEPKDTKFSVKRDENEEAKPYVFSTSGVRVDDLDTANSIAQEFGYFQKYSSNSYRNAIVKSDQEVKYFETEPYKGMPAQVPFDVNNGWYAATKQTLPVFGQQASYQQSGRVSSFWVCNVGEDGKIDFNSGKDICALFNLNTGQPLDVFPGLSESEARSKVRSAVRALEEAAQQYKRGVKKVTISGKSMKTGDPAANLPGVQCQDYMSPNDCKLLFNVCDPVICPSSRCNLGGKYYVDNVVSTGIVGGVFMCLPNVREGIAIPVCLTGIHAGIDNYVSILKASRDCLQESVDNGRYVGICDQITAIYKCEFFWRQISPLINNIIPSLLERITGQTSRGGGEYMTVQAAWDNMQNSIGYFKNVYAVDSLKAFNIRSTEEVGTPVCKAFVSTRYASQFKTLIEPDSPTQFTAWFDEIPQTTATTPARSQYKVFYHIFAGNDEGAQFVIYLKNAPGISFYETTGIQIVDTGFVPKGGYVSESKDLQSASGLQELCVRINTQEKCGFKRVSTSFALNYLQSAYIKEQATQQITSEQSCISGTPSVLALGAGGLNPQALGEEALMPQNYKRGIVRVCASANPGSSTGPERWQDVGYCSDTNIRCWIDKESLPDAFDAGDELFRNQTLDELDALAENLEEEKAREVDQDFIKKELDGIEKEINGLKGSIDEVKTGSRVVFTKLQILQDSDLYFLGSDNEARVYYLRTSLNMVLAEKAWESIVRVESVERESEGETESTCKKLSGSDWKSKKCGEGEEEIPFTDISDREGNEGKYCCKEVEEGEDVGVDDDGPVEPVDKIDEVKEKIQSILDEIDFDEPVEERENNIREVLNDNDINICSSRENWACSNINYFRYTSNNKYCGGTCLANLKPETLWVLIGIKNAVGGLQLTSGAETQGHSSTSKHYVGEAIDIDGENSVKFHDEWKELEDDEFEKKYGFPKSAIKVLGPGDPGHDSHVHVAVIDSSGIDYVKKKNELDSSSILAFKGTGNFELIDNCEDDLENRKQRLGIPDKLCYWEAMTELYDGKCDNLDEKDISEIFEKKAEYRQINNEDWPDLNVDGDFCVPVIYDCEKWDRPNNIHGAVSRDDVERNIYINPNLDFFPEFIENLLLHEGLHSIQELLGYNVFGYPQITDFVIKDLKIKDEKFKETYVKRGLLVDEILELTNKWFEIESNKCDEYSGTEKYMDCFDKVMENNDLLYDYEVDLKTFVVPIDFTDYVPIDNIYYIYFSSDELYLNKVDKLNDFLLNDFSEVSRLVRAGFYLADSLEIDPRLSEVSRWWLDETAPVCEVIYTKDKAEEVLNLFIIDSDISQEYKITQRDIVDLLTLAEIQGNADEIYEKLANRLPGLAEADDDIYGGGPELA